MNKYIIKVTEDDIRRGIKIDCFQCPIAKAVYRIINAGAKLWEEPYDVAVTNFTLNIFVNNSQRSIWIDLPQIAKDFISKFDNGGTPEPITFEIEF